MGSSRAKLARGAAAVVIASAALAACNLVLGTGYVVGPSDASAADACLAKPEDKAQLESACTSAACIPFDNATRNTKCQHEGTVCPTATGLPEAGAADAPASPEAGDAAAIPSCFSLVAGPAGGPLPPAVVYATGSTAIQTYVARVAAELEALSLATVVYLGAGSCFGVDAMLDPGTFPLAKIGATATYYDPKLDESGNVQTGTCAIDDPTRLADLGISDVFATTCVPSLVAQGGLPGNLFDFSGPVQVMEMVVPATSSQTSISAQAAYMVWGFGSASGVSPWTDEAFLLQRSASSGTQNMIGAAIGLDPALWHGVPNAASANVLAAIASVASGNGVDGGATTDPDARDKTLGILASDVADPNRQSLKPLAFQDVGEGCGYTPDSTAASFDKANVRDGHYPIWGPSHLIANVDSTGNATNANVKTLVDAMNGRNTQVAAALDVIAFYAKSHLVPTCAMRVQRASDGQDYEPYAPPTSCSCYYELQATGQTSCVPCSAQADCAKAPGGATSCVSAFGIPPVGYCEPPGGTP